MREFYVNGKEVSSEEIIKTMVKIPADEIAKFYAEKNPSPKDSYTNPDHSEKPRRQKSTRALSPYWEKFLDAGTTIETDWLFPTSWPR